MDITTSHVDGIEGTKVSKKGGSLCVLAVPPCLKSLYTPLLLMLILCQPFTLCRVGYTGKECSFPYSHSSQRFFSLSAFSSISFCLKIC